MTVCPIYSFYLNESQYYKSLNSEKSFYLILELTKKNRKYLLRIVKECISHKNFHGIIFLIDKNEILFERLFFLKDISIKLFNNNKKVGIHGLPYCVLQYIFGSDYFSRYFPDFISEDNQYYSKYIPIFQQNSSLLLKCAECIASTYCDGLGSRIENHYIWSYRTSHTYRALGRDILFQTDNAEMQNMYDSFCTYIDNSDLTYADRYLYFTKNIDLGSAYSFSDRFVYHCDFPPKNEYKKELNFLSTYIENRTFLPIIETLLNRDEVCRIAYSKANKDNISRESFYINPNGENNYYLLNYFNIKLDISFPNKFLGVGIDYYNGKIKSYKIYFVVSSEILMQIHPEYFNKIDIELFSLQKKEHYYIIRLDADKKMVSERIDLIYNDKDSIYFQKYLKKLPFSDSSIASLFIFAFAFEFESNQLNKINIYYRNKF